MKKWASKKELHQFFNRKEWEKHFIGRIPRIADGVPCEHPGCLNHRSHPCEGCGRIGGSDKLTEEYYTRG